MKAGFYPRIAMDGIRKNRRMYLPYFMTCALMAAMFYILSFLSRNTMLNRMSGGETLRLIMMLGQYVMAVFAAVFLFYTNSFLIRRRKKEFGLYNILGMGKGSIGRILLWETAMTGLLSLTVGLGAGIALSKLAELGLSNIIGGDIAYDFSVSLSSVRDTAFLLAGVFLLIYLNDLRQVHTLSPVQLLKSENVGEKPPKANWALGLLGVVILCLAYDLSVSIQNPVEALLWFFAAVIMVIAATYLLMISGSVLLCRILQKKKSYYYQPNHFVSVSSMAYRMKRNGAGLASICILVTMVLVMISSSACLYFGAENSLRARYPRDFIIEADFDDIRSADEKTVQTLRDSINALCKTDTRNLLDYREMQITGALRDGVLQPDLTTLTGMEALTYADVVTVYMISTEDYNRITGEHRALSDGEALIHAQKKDLKLDTLTIESERFELVGTLETLDMEGASAANITSSIFLIVPDLEKAARPLLHLRDFSGRPMLTASWYYGFDTELDGENQTGLRDRITTAIDAEADRYPGLNALRCDCLYAQRGDFYATFGGLFFLGVMLSVVFLVAAALIIYYKQVSEGYEDDARFEIMQKVGMTKRDIKRNINSQMLTVFFLPLGFGIMHLCFAFPMIRKLLLLFNVNNLPLLLLTTAVSVFVFAAFYLAVYRMTANAYYAIVSGGKS